MMVVVADLVTLYDVLGAWDYRRCGDTTARPFDFVFGDFWYREFGTAFWVRFRDAGSLHSDLVPTVAGLQNCKNCWPAYTILKLIGAMGVVYKTNLKNMSRIQSEFRQSGF